MHLFKQKEVNMKHTAKKKKTTLSSSEASSPQKAFNRLVFFLFLFLLLFAALLMFLISQTSKTIKKNNPDFGAAILKDLLTPFPDIIDNLYRNNLDEPMETLFSSPEFIGFSFSSKQYLADNMLLIRLRDLLAAFTKSSDYIISSFIYASSTDTCITDLTVVTPSGIEESESQNAYFNDIIYDYNSNIIEKSQIAVSGHHTFMFRYEDSIIIAKDLTTLSGQAHSTVFVILDIDRFASSIYDSYRFLDPYRVSVYDPHSVLLFTNKKTDKEITRDTLHRLASAPSSIDKRNDSYLIYCSSDVLRWQYVLEVGQNYLAGDIRNNRYIYLLSAFAALLLISLSTAAFYLCFRRPAAELLSALIPRCNDAAQSAVTLPLLKEKIIALAKENQTLTEIVSSTSTEAVSALFSLLITGQHADMETIQITLSNTSFGFTPHDIYVAGIIHYSSADHLDVEDRYRILNLINTTFKKFKAKNTCNAFCFVSGGSSFAVIVSFAFQTSIAKGKAKINDLTVLLNKSFEFANLPLDISFGHMYTSILDLPFSYSEAQSSLYHKSSQADAHSESRRKVLPVITANAASKSSPEKSASSADASDSPAPFAEAAFYSLIDRRASQITQLIYENKSRDVSTLVDRTITDIFKDDSYQNQYENSKRLISALIDNMISYPFVNASELSDVYGNTSIEIDSDISSAEMRQTVRKSIDILCEDFSEILKKQRNPYIVSALEYIKVHYENPDLSLEELAEHLKIAPNYLSTIFSKSLGKKLFEYVNEYRLEKSIDLLQSTNKTINDISIECGFGSSRNYIRIFKKYKETTPGAYRKEHLSRTARQTID